MPVTPFTIEELARLSDEEALRSSSNAAILKALRWVLRFFFVVSLVEWLTASQGTGPAGVAIVNLLVVVGLLLGFRRLTSPKKGLGRRLSWFEPLARLLRVQSRGVASTYLVLQLWMVMLFTSGGSGIIPWLVLFPQIVLLFRFGPAERFALHAIFILSAVVGWLAPLILDLSNARFEHVVSATVANAVALGVGLYIARRISRRFLAEWREARGGAREQIRMRQELESAREIQLSMLPRETPELEWVDLASVSIPATEVGGDYYDFFFPSANRLVLVSADVAGHGLGSGLVLSGVRSGLALLADELDHPELVMGRLHRMLRKTTGTRMLVTMALLSLDPETMGARYATAGHPPLLIRRAGTGKVDEVLRSSLPLGAAMSADYVVDEIPFGSGDVFILHTDGVYEMRNNAGDAYGLDRLAAVLGEQDDSTTAREVRDAILRDVFAFRDHAPQEDDLTLVVAKVR